MQLISVNVALPKVVSVQGRSVETGIFKRPVAGPVAVGALNLDGDRQAALSVHGGPDKALYVYSWKTVEFWRESLCREDLYPGTFGENLTADGLLDDEVAIGDQLEIGTARFEVTQPRLPCYKLGIALGQSDFPKIFHRSGRNGFYLRVLREGRIAAGDSIRKIPVANSGKMTIAEFVEVARARRPTREAVDRVVRLRAIPESWKLWLLEKLEAR
jgi:MOSC domain-containing protein YiiM